MTLKLQHPSSKRLKRGEETDWENKQDVEDLSYTVHAEGGCAGPFRATSECAGMCSLLSPRGGYLSGVKQQILKF